MTNSKSPILIQRRHDWIKSILKGLLIASLTLIIISVGIYIYISDLSVIIKGFLYTTLLAFLIFITFKIPTTHKIIHQNSTHITITSGIWHKHTLTIAYTDIIYITTPHSFNNKPTPTIVNIYYYHNHQIHHTALPLFRHDDDIVIQFENFLYQLNFSHRLQNTQTSHPFPIIINSHYGRIVFTRPTAK